jgi:hypothetical protein
METVHGGATGTLQAAPTRARVANHLLRFECNLRNNVGLWGRF